MLPPPSDLIEPQNDWPIEAARTVMPRTMAMYLTIRKPAISLPVVTISCSIGSGPMRYGCSAGGVSVSAMRAMLQRQALDRVGVDEVHVAIGDRACSSR